MKLFDNQIKWILQVLGEKNIPSEPSYSFNGEKIAIEFDKEETLFVILKYIYDKFFIIISNFQIKICFQNVHKYFLMKHIIVV